MESTNKKIVFGNFETAVGLGSAEGDNEEPLMKPIHTVRSKQPDNLLIKYCLDSSSAKRSNSPKSKLEEEIAEAVSSDLDLTIRSDSGSWKSTPISEASFEVADGGRRTRGLQACSTEVLLKLLQSGIVGQGSVRNDVIARTSSRTRAM